jgi:hypothetical protein
MKISNQILKAPLDSINREQAVAIYKSNIWKSWTAEQVVKFQLFQERLCMDFAHFHKCAEKVFQRPIYTHEFANRHNLISEYLQVKTAPTMQEIIDMIPDAVIVKI